MPSSDRTLRAFAQAEPDVIARLLRAVAPGLLPNDTQLQPEDVSDPHAHGLPAPRDADLVARAGSNDVLHVEFQGYRDTEFMERVVYYHLTFVLRFKPRNVHTVALWLVRPPAAQLHDVIQVGDVTVRIRNIVLANVNAEDLLKDPQTACFAVGADASTIGDEELCRQVVRMMKASGASAYAWETALVAAGGTGRYEQLMSAMRVGNVDHISIDLIKFGEDRGELKSARHDLLDVLDARGLVPNADQKAMIAREESVERIRTWLRAAATATNVQQALA